MKTLFVLLSMLLAAPTFAQTGPKQASIDLGPVLNGQTLEATRGFSVVFPKLEGWGLATLFFEVTDANDTVTSLTMKCFARGKDVPMTLTGITRANCSTKSITIQVSGTSYTLTEATDWARGATDVTATAALVAAINGITGQPVEAIGAVGAANTISLTPRGSNYSMWVYSSDATCATAVPGVLRSSVQTGPVATGTFTSYDASWVAGNATNQPLNPAGADGQKMWPWRVDIENLREMKCTLTVGGVGASTDKVYVYARLATKGS